MKIKLLVLLVGVLISLPCVSTAEQSSEYQRQLAQSEQNAARIKAQSEQNAARIKAQSEQNAARIKAQSEQNAARIKAQSEQNAARIKAQSEQTAAAMKAQSERTAAWFKAQSEQTAAWFKAQSEQTAAWFKTQSEKTNAWFKAVADYMNMNVADPLQPRNIAPDVGTQAIIQGVTSGIPGAGEIVDISNAGADLIKPVTQIAVTNWNKEFAAAVEGLDDPPFIDPNWASTNIPQMIALDKELKQLQTKLGDGKSLNPMNPQISPGNLKQYQNIVNKYILRK